MKTTTKTPNSFQTTILSKMLKGEWVDKADYLSHKGFLDHTNGGLTKTGYGLALASGDKELLEAARASRKSVGNRSAAKPGLTLGYEEHFEVNNFDNKKIEAFLAKNSGIITGIAHKKHTTELVMQTTDPKELDRRCHAADSSATKPELLFDVCVGYDAQGDMFVTNTRCSLAQVASYTGLPRKGTPNTVYLWWD